MTNARLLKTALRSRSWSWVVLLALFVAGSVSAADVRVMISAGLDSVYSELGSAFEKSTGHHLVTTRPPPSRELVAKVVPRGEAEIGFQQLSELIHVSGLTFVGALPSELQPPVSAR